MRSVRLLPAILALAAVAAVGWLGWQRTGPRAAGARIPILDGPPPLPHLQTHPVTTPVRVVVRDVDLTTTSGVRVRVPRAEIVAAPGPGGDPLVRVRRLVLERPVVTVPAEIGSGGAPAVPEPELPRIRIDTLRVRDGAARARAAEGSGPGRWRFDLRNIDLLLTDAELGGGRPDRGRVRLSLDGRYEGRPLAVRGLDATLRRTPERLAFTARGRVNGSEASVEGTVADGGRLDVAVVSDTFDLDDFRPFVPGLPPVGGAFTGRIARGGGETRLDVERARLRSEGAVLELEGDLAVGGGAARARHLDVRFEGVSAEQAARYGLDLPLPGRYSGTLRVRAEPGAGAPEGRASDGPPPMRVRAEVARVHEGRASRLSAEGSVAPGPPARVDLLVAVDPVVVDSTFEARLRVRGPLDSLAIAGDVALVRTGGDGPPRPIRADVDVRLLGATGDRPAAEGSVALFVDPSLLREAEDDGEAHSSAPDPGAPFRAVVTGRAALEDGALDARLRADSVPLALLPLPDGVAEARGFAAGTLTFGGTLDAPTVGGQLRIIDGGARLTAAGTRLEAADGRIRLGNGAIEVTELIGRAGGGALRVTGRVVPGTVAGIAIAGATGGPRTVDLRLVADSVEVLRDPLARVAVSGGVTVTGTIDEPRIAGRVRPSGWVLEDYLVPGPGGIDLDDPPHAALAARAPWTARGRLGRPAPPPRRDIPARIGGALTVDVDHGIVILDEDSELRGSGTLRVTLDGGMAIQGVVALEEGFYAQYGTRFDVYGGALVFDGTGTRPRVALRSDYRDPAPLGLSNEGEPKAARFPPVRMFGYSDGTTTLEHATRYTLLPNSQIDLARLVLLGVEPEPVTGWRHPVFWTPAAGGEPFGSRAAANAIPLLWSYVADVAYDFVSIRRAYLSTDLLSVGEEYPGRLVVTPSLRGSIFVDDRVELRAGQALTGVLPRIELIYRAGRFELEAFTAPHYFATPALGGVWPGYRSRQATGLGLRWSREY